VGIRAKHFERVKGVQDKEKARNKAFYGRVTAVDLLDHLTEVELMSDSESREGFKVRSITIHGDMLTWFIVTGAEPGKKKNLKSKRKSYKIFVRQRKF
jgi:hypothetical protein